MRGLRLGLGLNGGIGLPITPVLSDFGAGSIDDLELDPPAIFIEHNTSGTLTGDFDVSATPPAKEAGSIGFFTTSLSGDAVTDISTALNTFLDLHPGETGYLHFRLTNGAGDSNIITTQEITVPSPFAPPDLASLVAWYDPSDLSTLWKDELATDPVTADGDVVARVDDKSGNGYNLTDGDPARHPVYRTSGGLHWLEFDGSDDRFVHSIPSGKYAVFAGVRLLSAGSGYTTFFGGTGAGSGILFLARTGTGVWGTYSTTDEPADTALTTGVDYVIGMNGTTSGAFRLNGADDGTYSATDGQSQGTVFGASGQQPNGRLYGLIVTNAALAGADLTNTESHLAAKSGVTL